MSSTSHHEDTHPGEVVVKHVNDVSPVGGELHGVGVHAVKEGTHGGHHQLPAPHHSLVVGRQPARWDLSGSGDKDNLQQLYLI